MKDAEVIMIFEKNEELHEISGIVLTLQNGIGNAVKKQTQCTS
jgi:hypothetical protein